MTVTFLELGYHGRLGNALFQIAATIGYSKKFDIPFCFPKWEHQHCFKIPEELFVDRVSIVYSSEYKEPRYAYSEIPFQGDCSLSGYFQSWKYFSHCQELIRELLFPELVEDLRDYCCVHVRRGDYLRYPKHHPTQTMEYYMAAAEKMPIKKFMVFSDDVAWCKDMFKGEGFEVNETTSLISDFRKMVSCSHFIIANSSFSWWPAWLSKSEGKVVVAPSNWFGPSLNGNHPITDLIPPEWILI